MSYTQPPQDEAGPRRSRGLRHLSTARRMVCASAAVAALCGVAAAIPAMSASASSAPSTQDAAAPAADTYSPGDLMTGAVETQLTAVYAAARGIPVADVAGVAAGSLAQAGLGTTQYAVASFMPALSDPDAVLAEFQDGADTAVFSRGPDGLWKPAAGGLGLSCPGALSADVQKALGLTDATECDAAAASAADPATDAAKVKTARIAKIAENNIGLTDNPPASRCDPFTTMVGVAASSSGCGRNAKFKVLDRAEFWCADFAKWVWRTAGVKSDLNVLTPSAASFYPWGQKHHEGLRKDSKSFAVGDAIAFFPPGTEHTFADHVGIVVGVDKAKGTVDIVNGDFGSSVIEVENDVVKISDLQHWADTVWNRTAKHPERWYLISPNG